MFKNQLLLSVLILIIGASCKKKSEDTPLAIVAERLEISPASKSILKDQNFQFTIKYFNNVGIASSLPNGIIWSSSNENVARVNKQGMVSGISAGQAQIKATINQAFAVSFLTVVEDDKQLATLVISSNGTQVLNLNSSVQLSANGKSLSGNIIPDLTFSWKSSHPNIVEVSQSGLVTAKANGTASVSVSSAGIESAPIMVQVNKISTFSGKGSGGEVKLKVENNILKLETFSDFQSASKSQAPDLRFYLSNNSGNVNGGIEIASINQRNGAQVCNVPSGVSINQYKYVVIWCKQYGVYYGSADLGN